MPKVKARVLDTKAENGNLLATVQFNKKLPQRGEIITVKWGSTRTLSQNALLWTYYSWLINHGGMKDHGFFCKEAIHSSIKSHFLDEKIMSKGQWKTVEDGTTTMMNKMEFGELVNTIDMFIVDFFGIDTSPFWEEYDKVWKMT